MSPGDDPKKEEKKIKLEVTPELQSQVKEFLIGTFGAGLVAGGLFGSLVFFLLFNIVGYYCTPDNYLLTERINILFFSIRLLIGIAVIMGFIFSIVYRNTSVGKYKKILIAVLVAELIFAGAFVLAFETPHCKNYQRLISSKPMAKGEITVIDERQLTSDETWDTLPIWSPDGSKLAFLRERPMVFDVVDIWVMNRGGGNLRQVVSEPLEMEYPAWSPDGRKIAYVSWTSGNRDIWVVDILRGGPKQLTSGNQEGHISPLWSPDGMEIVYLTVGARDQDIWIMDSNGENQRQVTRGEENDKSPSLSLDGTKIVFVRDKDGAGDIWVVNKDGTGLKQLTEGTSSESNPRWSPDGSRIAFLSRPPQQPASAQIAGEKAAKVYDTLWIMNSDGSGVKQLSLDRADVDYSWSPRGDMIAFVKLAENIADIWVVSVDGSYERKLSLSQPFPIGPAWSPDGSRIVYSVFGTGRRNLWEALLTQ
ncbi:MAG: hypothetical protein ACE5HY_00920 [Candidatus Hydrothermarchaeales archaeon]